MKKIVLYMLLLLSGQYAMAQTGEPAKQEKESLNNQPWAPGKTKTKPVKPQVINSAATSRDKNAREHISSLKNGALLVRLRTSDIAIKKLEDAGNKEMAASIRKQRQSENKKLADAFRQHFTFCPVYFFFSSDSDKIKNGQPDGILLNQDLKRDPSIALGGKKIYVTEITDLEQFRSQPDNPSESHNPEVSFKALVVRDAHLHQLAKPFPFFIKASTNIPPRRRSETEMVKLLDKKLQEYYAVTTKKPTK